MFTKRAIAKYKFQFEKCLAPAPRPLGPNINPYTTYNEEIAFMSQVNEVSLALLLEEMELFHRHWFLPYR